MADCTETRELDGGCGVKETRGTYEGVLFLLWRWHVVVLCTESVVHCFVVYRARRCGLPVCQGRAGLELRHGFWHNYGALQSTFQVQAGVAGR